ncbi:hypothetical protein AgCh_037662 [Apium graveolens]
MFQFAKFEKSKERRLATELGYGFPIGDPWITDGISPWPFTSESVLPSQCPGIHPMHSFRSCTLCRLVSHRLHKRYNQVAISGLRKLVVSHVIPLPPLQSKLSSNTHSRKLPCPILYYGKGAKASLSSFLDLGSSLISMSSEIAPFLLSDSTTDRED